MSDERTHSTAPFFFETETLEKQPGFITASNAAEGKELMLPHVSSTKEFVHPMTETDPTLATRRRNICLVGPVLPFRGGISHYNGMLFRALQKFGVETSMFSFSRQYPKLIYPGAGDREPGFENYVEPDVEYSLDSINPLSWLKTARAIALREPDLVIFHWWTVFWAPCFWLITKNLKRRGIRVGLICHNLVDHDAGLLKERISTAVLKIADCYLVHSTEHAQILREYRPNTRLVQHVIPVYGNYPKPAKPLAKRGRLELLFFGFIRSYKGLDVLMDAMRELNDTEVYLTIIGEHWGKSDQLAEQASQLPNIDLHLGYMSEEDAANHFSRADFVILPYLKATGSAVASVAFHYNKPIIASRTGGLIDVVIEGRTGKLVTPGDVAVLTQTLMDTQRNEAISLSEGVREFKDHNDWASLCSRLVELSS